MKKILAIALLGVGAQWGAVQAKEAPDFQPRESTTLADIKQTHRRHQPLTQARPLRVAPRLTEQRPHKRPATLRQAGHKVEKLEKQQRRVAAELKRAKRYRASHWQSKQLRAKLNRVQQKLTQAKQQYRFLLKRELGAYHYSQLMQHTHWLDERGDRRRDPKRHTNYWR